MAAAGNGSTAVHYPTAIFAYERTADAVVTVRMRSLSAVEIGAIMRGLWLVLSAEQRDLVLGDLLHLREDGCPSAIPSAVLTAFQRAAADQAS
jgi:hypothetical protein